MPGGNSRDQAAPFYAVLARLRAEKDPSAAFDWALALDPLVRSAAAIEALKEWAKSDPTEAWKKLVSMDEKQFQEVCYDETRNPLGTRMLRKIAENDPATAMKLILETKGHGGLFSSGGIDAMTGALASALNQGTMTGVDAYRMLTTVKGSDSHNLGLNVLTQMWSGLPEDRLADAAKGILQNRRRTCSPPRWRASWELGWSAILRRQTHSSPGSRMRISAGRHSENASPKPTEEISILALRPTSSGQRHQRIGLALSAPFSTRMVGAIPTPKAKVCPVFPNIGPSSSLLCSRIFPLPPI